MNIAWQYTGGAQSGSLTFGPGTLNFPYPAGCYFAEYYQYNVAMADATFYVGSTPVTPKPMMPPTMKPVMPPVVIPVIPKPVVSPVMPPVMPPTMPGQATVTTNKSVYNAGEQIMVMFTNPSPMTQDWIGIYRTDSFVNIEYKFTGGGSSGTVSFSSAGYAGGAYFAEFYNANDVYLAEVAFSVIAAPIAPTPPTGAPTFSPGASVTTSKQAYARAEPIVVSFTNNSPTTQDWIGLYNAVTLANVGWEFTGGGTSGTLTFGTDFASFPFPAGSYYAALFNTNDVQIAEGMFGIN